MDLAAESFGSLVFGDEAMKEYLPPEVYASLRRTIEEGGPLDAGVAEAVASGMKEWAVSKGATHFTHWFQPLTGVTAEKHESFVTPRPGGRAVFDFSGKELIKGEADGSSLPSGGLRATFEARGYTAWDPTSYAFIKDRTLCIPTAFASYGGEALDKKTPLLRSVEALSRQAVRVLGLLGSAGVSSVTAMAGPEQEYFLVPLELYEKRPDLRFCGRTLLGARPPKGQELSDHYYGMIKPSVAAFMNELNEELWAHGIPARTEHNEVAPSQHELAVVYDTANIATDHNQLAMELMQKTAARHGLACLLHEKPFEHLNGSGKHNNWSLQTDTGVNLLSPGDTPHENLQFLLFLSAVIKAVDEWQDLLRISVASAGNDHRLGGNEAPPAVISIYLGEELTEMLEAIERGSDYEAHGRVLMELGAQVLPKLSKDNTDRNRTSPFAFTGNKFEFRMPGSSQSISGPNIMLNAAVADVLEGFADELEAAIRDGSKPGEAAYALIRHTVREHRRIIFNGNGYDESWLREAVEKRGLSDLRTTPECLARLLCEKNVSMLERHGVYSEAELVSRRDISLDNYCRTLFIEARTMSSMAGRQILPAVQDRLASVASGLISRNAAGFPAGEAERESFEELSGLSNGIRTALARLGDELSLCESMMGRDGKPGLSGAAERVRSGLIPAMEELRELCDAAELEMPKELWPFPGYDDLLFGVR
jgi:glutamine synthetase